MAADPDLATQLNDPLAPLLGYQLKRASVAMSADLARQLATLDLKLTESSILMLIAANPGVTQSEIGRQLAIKSANMAPMTAALEAKGLIGREQVDGRSHGLAITPQGEALCAKVRERIAAHEGRFQSAISEDTYRRLVADLQLIWS